MASTSETGHAKNIANFKLLNETNTGFGGAYNPSNPLLAILAMEAQQTDCDAKQTVVNQAQGVYKPLQNARKVVFEPLQKLVRRVRSFAKSCGATAQWYKDVNTVCVKILGERASKTTATASDPAGTSASQQSFDNTINNFEALIELLKNEPLYNPNEIDLKTASLDGLLTALKTANNSVKSGVQPLNQAIIARNKLCYTTDTGLVDVAKASKNYVRSTFGFSSPEFKLVSKIKFVKLADVD